MRAHYLQHVSFEGLGSIASWLDAQNYEITVTRFYAQDPLPDPNTIDMLIIMGGPMSVHDTAIYPWLIEEKRFIQQCILMKKPVLGICLGAQLIAQVMGGEVFANPQKEIGWFDIHSVNSLPSAFAFPQTLQVFHWHGETFTLPKEAVHLAQNQVCTHQAFQISNHVLGLQFHLETTPQLAQDLVTNCSNELIDAPYIQSAQRIVSVSKAQYHAMNAMMSRILDYLSQSIKKEHYDT